MIRNPWRVAPALALQTILLSAAGAAAVTPPEEAEEAIGSDDTRAVAKAATEKEIKQAFRKLRPGRVVSTEKKDFHLQVITHNTSP